MANDDVQTNLRIPAELKERLQVAADAAGRSLSAEAAFRLGQAFELEDSLNEMSGNIRAARAEVVRATEEVHHMRAKSTADERTIAALEERISLIASARTADIEAATKHLEQRVEFLAEKAAFAQREAESARAAQQALAKLNRVVGDYLSLVAGMVQKTSPEGIRLMELIRSIGDALRDDDFATAVEAASVIGKMAAEEKLVALKDKPGLTTSLAPPGPPVRKIRIPVKKK